MKKFIIFKEKNKKFFSLLHPNMNFAPVLSEKELFFLCLIFSDTGTVLQKACWYKQFHSNVSWLLMRIRQYFQNEVGTYVFPF